MIETPAILSGQPRREVQTRALDDAELASSRSREAQRAAWDDVINHHLIEWGRDPGALAEDDFVPPSVETITLAFKVAKELRDRGYDPPVRVLPDGNGGISFEHGDATYFETLNVYEDGTVELLVFQDCQLLERHLLC